MMDTIKKAERTCLGLSVGINTSAVFGGDMFRMSWKKERLTGI